jgi:hypothetical protein
MARLGTVESSWVTSWVHGLLGGTGVTGEMERSHVGDYQGRSAHGYRGLHIDPAGALASPIGPAAGGGDGPVRPGNLRSRKIPGQRLPTGQGAATPWWKSKWWHIAVLGLCTAIFFTSLLILAGVW